MEFDALAREAGRRALEAGDEASRPELHELVHRAGRRRALSTITGVAVVVGAIASVGLWAASRASESLPPTEQTQSSGPVAGLSATWPGTWSHRPSTLRHDELLPRLFSTDVGLLVIYEQNGGTTVAGEIYDPTTGRATEMAPSGLEWRAEAAMAWTGHELLIVGGANGPGIDNIGAAYRPANDLWRHLPDPPIPVDAWDNAIRAPAVWTGSEMLLLDHGLAYDPGTDRWRFISASPGPSRVGAVAVWTGTEAILWGGCDAAEARCDDRGVGILIDGVAYDPHRDTWHEIADSPLLPGVHPRGVWTGTELLIYAGFGSAREGAEFAAYAPSRDSWRILDEPPLSPRRHSAAAWTGERFVIWGGSDPDGGGTLGDGAAYDMLTRTWGTLPPSPPNAERDRHAIAWTGEELYVAGGVNSSGPIAFEPKP